MTDQRSFFLKALLSLLFVFFVISHNFCWLNPSKNKPTVFFPIPYGWEYDYDSGLELYSAIDYPWGMLEEKIRIARPLKNAVISVGIDFIDFFYPLDDRKKLAASYVFHHALNLLMCIVLLLILSYVGKKYDVGFDGLFIAWLFFLSIVFQTLSTSHTTIFQFTISATIVACLLRISQLSYSTEQQRIIVEAIYALFCGCLVLIKQNYAPYLAVLFYYFALRNFKPLLIWIVIFNLPYLLYRYTLFWGQVDYYDHEIEHYKHGTWFLDYSFIDDHLLLVKKIIILAGRSTDALVSQYGIVFLSIAIIGFLDLSRKVKSFNIHLFSLCLVVSTYIQAIGARKTSPDMFSDIYIITALFFAIGYKPITIQYSSYQRFIRNGFYIFIAIIFITKIITMITLPWVHPFSQIG